MLILFQKPLDLLSKKYLFTLTLIHTITKQNCLQRCRRTLLKYPEFFSQLFQEAELRGGGKKTHSFDKRWGTRVAEDTICAKGGVVSFQCDEGKGAVMVSENSQRKTICDVTF